MNSSTSTRPWIFVFTTIPYGVATAFAATVMPFVLRGANLTVEQIGWYSALVAVPIFAQFLYTPIVDFKFRRKVWLFWVTFLASILISAALLVPLPNNVNLFMILIFLSQIVASLIGSCNGGLMATLLVSDQKRQAGVWHSIGNLSGGAIGVGVILTMAARYPLKYVAVVVFTFMMLPLLVLLFIPEPHVKRNMGLMTIFKTAFKELWLAVNSKVGLIGILLCISPVGTVALTNAFSGIAKDYSATYRMVAFVNGAMNSLATIAGSFIAGYIGKKISHKHMYLIAGLLTTIVGFGMIISPIHPLTYTIGVIAYYVVVGFANSSFYALVLETIGKTGVAASTLYTIFSSTANLAITYVVILNTRYHKSYGPKALLASDAILNMLGVIFLVFVIHKIIPRIGDKTDSNQDLNKG